MTQQQTDQNTVAGQLSHIELEVSAGERTAVFLSQLFAWQFAKFSQHYWLCEPNKSTVPNVAIGVLEKPEPNLLDACPVFIAVADIEKSLRRAEQLGATVVETAQRIPDYGQWAKLKEPGGNTIGLFQKASCISV